MSTLDSDVSTKTPSFISKTLLPPCTCVQGSSPQLHRDITMPTMFGHTLSLEQGWSTR